MRSRSLQTEFASPKEFFESITGREEIQLLTDHEIQEYFFDKKVLITGAGGTIGSAVARRLNDAGISETYYLDRDESALHALALSLSNTAASHSNKCLVADVRDVRSLEIIFEETKPDLIIHTAALKHLVVLERFPREGYLTNILGTLNVLSAAANKGIAQVLNVSTDKAALPSSVLGKTKLIAEHLTQEFNTKEMLTSSVRFGNVFASRGSVIETFIHQINNNLAVTVSHPEVTRFFMSHNEAANLILTTSIMQENAIFVQEMGTRIKIVDIVTKLANKFGIVPNLEYVGLQPGEKLHEDLYEKEFLKTSNSAIVQLPFQEFKGVMKIISGINTPGSHIEALNVINSVMTLIETSDK
jgi:FlaA1/EpsC-like NDP-sugar epimerase